jgi:hypothetical protein
MSSGENSVVLLKSHADWPRWIAVIQTKANHNDVWDYIKPTLNAEEVRPELHKPSPPVVTTFSTTADATLQSLDSDQLKRYEMAYKVYKDELKDWERKQTTINDIDDYIMRTTGAYWSTIERVQGVLERLKRLKEHVAPSNYAREQEVLARYESVRKSAKATKTDEWLRQWESALSDIKERKLPEAEGIRPTRAFLQAVEQIQPLFSQTWTNTIESTAIMSPTEDLTKKIPDGFKIAQIFRSQTKLANPNAAFSTATLQGEEAPTPPPDPKKDNQDRKQRCFEGKHALDRCYYLRKDLRPEGWEMRAWGAREILKGLKDDQELTKKYAQAIKEIEEFLKKQDQGKDEDSNASKEKTVIGTA